MDIEGAELRSEDNQTYYDERFLMWNYLRPATVYVNDDVVEPTEYDVHYNPTISGNNELPAKVVFKSPLSDSDVVTVDFSYNHLPIRPSFTGGYDPPFLAITSGASYTSPLELGGAEEAVVTFIMDLYAENMGQRDDLADEVVDVLKKTAYLIDFNKGFPIDYLGRKNEQFDFNNQRLSIMQIGDIQAQANPTGYGDELELNRALITCSVKAIRKY